jgi:hypothetical protein
MTPAPRRKLGRNVGVITRELIFETADGVEVDSREGYDIVRKRVLFEEVLLVTIHRAYGVTYVVVMLLLSIVFGILAVGFQFGAHEAGAAITFAILALPFLIALIVRLVLKLDFVTVFGRRSKAVMRFAVKKRRAREVYGHICARAREVQRSMEPPPAAPVPVEEPPLPPASE